MRNRSQALTVKDVASIDWAKGGGLVPAMVQDRATLQLLMLAYMNEQALRETIETRRAVFYSRSRQKIWRKGETSGAIMGNAEVFTDCDSDALLVLADPAGPACHVGTVSCFSEQGASGVGWLAQLEKIVEDRRQCGEGKDSYTRRLFDGGRALIAKKVGEEGVEVALAGFGQDTEQLIDESADLLFHLIVLLRERDVSLGQVAERLRRRHEAL